MTDLPMLSDLEANTPAGPLGHRGPRGEILLQLKLRSGATSSELAECLSCSLNAVRHHLKELEAEGVVGYDRTHRGVGAPAHTYHLTDSGHALFPERYQSTVNDLIDHVVRNEGREAAVALLTQRYDALSRRLTAELSQLSAGAPRGEVIARVLAEEGYMATWHDGEAGGLLTEHHCPHQLIAERFPEICAAEHAVLTTAFGAEVDRRSRIAGGCGTCSYQVTENQASTIEEGR